MRDYILLVISNVYKYFWETKEILQKIIKNLIMVIFFGVNEWKTPISKYIQRINTTMQIKRRN